MHNLIRAAVVLGTLLLAIPIQAQTQLDGYFTAAEECEANKKKSSDNPGNVRLEVGRQYKLFARNGTPGTHYQIRVPGAPGTEKRWVPMTCGQYSPDKVRQAAAPARQELQPRSGGAGVTENLLAASWQPTFCATGAGRGKEECRTQSVRRFDATHFSLHGLWPDDLDDTAAFPCYCGSGKPTGCDAKRRSEGRLNLARDVKERLRRAMPGMQSGLERHEWSKHGTCYEQDLTGPDAGSTPDEYFTEAMSALDALNASPVQRFFADHIGEEVTRSQVEAAFDRSFGRGAGKRVLIRCANVNGKRAIAELWVNLKGSIGEPADLRSLIQAAPTTASSSRARSCPGGVITAVSR